MNFFKIIIGLSCLCFFSCKQEEKKAHPISKTVEVVIEINNKIQELNSSLKQFTDSSTIRSHRILNEIERNVEQRGVDSTQINALKRAQEMNKWSNQTIDYIEELKKKMISDSAISEKEKMELESNLEKFIKETRELSDSLSHQ